MKYYLSTYAKKRQYILLLGDILVLALSIFISYFLRVYLAHKSPTMAVVLSRLSPWLILVISAHLFTLYMLDQYNLNRLVNLFRNSIMVVFSICLAGLIISGIFFFFPKYVFGRKVLLIHLLVTSFLIVLWRSLAITVLIKKAKKKRLAVLGNGQTVSSFIEDLSHLQNSGFTIGNVCIVNNDPPGICILPKSLVKHQSVLTLLKHNDFDALAFDSANGLFKDDEIRKILQLKFRGKAVYDLPKLYENLTGKVPLTYIDGHWLLSSDGLQGEMNVTYVKTKRIIDIVLASSLLLLTSPLSLLIVVLIKLDSAGEIFFVQERLGLQRKPFRCLKFRTMVKDAEIKSGPIWSCENDTRVTRVGRLLRKTRLDELPQLWNILKGDMSFVGPRPIREYFANMLEQRIPFYGLRFAIKPGLTGWAQVNYKYGGSKEGQFEKFQYELFYIRNMSPFLDLLTMFKTIKTIFEHTGE